jgi:ABC-type molybdate transport system ATPase subunit
MNQIEAVVTDIKKTDIITYIEVKSGNADLRLIKSKAPSWLTRGDKVKCMFQEAAVCVSKECPGKVSIENKLPVTLKATRQNESLCELTFESEIGKVVSLITEDAYTELGLETDCSATMLVRGVDISIEPIL